MAEKRIIAWTLDANEARPSEAVVNTQGFKDAVRVCEQQSRVFAEMAKNVGVFDKHSAVVAQFDRIRDLMELPNAKFLDLAQEVGLGPVSQAIAAIEKSRPAYQGLIDAMPEFSVVEKMLRKDIDLGAKSLALHNMITAPGLAEMAEIAGIMKRAGKPHAGWSGRFVK